MSSVTIPNLESHSALGQIEKLALEQGFTIGAETYGDHMGNLTLIHHANPGLLHTLQGYPIVIQADEASHKVLIAAKLNQGRTATAESMKTTLCGLLTKVTMDETGAANAAAAHAQTHSDEIINVKAIDLASEIHKAMFWHLSESQTIGARYVGRTYRIDGQVFIAAAAANRAFDDLNGVQSFDILYITYRPGLLGGKHEQPIQTMACAALLSSPVHSQTLIMGHAVGETVEQFLDAEPYLRSRLQSCHEDQPRPLTPQQISDLSKEDAYVLSQQVFTTYAVSPEAHFPYKKAPSRRQMAELVRHGWAIVLDKRMPDVIESCRAVLALNAPPSNTPLVVRSRSDSKSYPVTWRLRNGRLQQMDIDFPDAERPPRLSTGALAHAELCIQSDPRSTL